MMQLIEYDVRTDWQEYESRKTAENTRFWRLVLVLVGISMAAMLLIRVLQLEQAASLILSILFSSALYFVLPLSEVFRVYRQKKWFAALTLLFVAGIGLIAGWLYPHPTTGSPLLTASGAFLILTLGYCLFAVIKWSNPVVLRKWGYIQERRKVNLLIGVLVGGALSLHFFFTTNFFPVAMGPLVDRLPKALWYCFFLAGYAALGEELLLRGFCFQLLFDETKNNLSRAALQIAILSMFMTFLPILPSGKPALWVAFIAYRFIASYLSVLLRYWRGSLFPGYTLNIVAQTLMIMVLL